MSLPAPNLDDRSFQDIVDDVKRQIGHRCPEWTDHNVHDPGVTLIELFAWVMEMALYRLNRVPEKQYIKFLEMLGVSLDPPTPARTLLRFILSRPIEDRDGEEAYERILRARETVGATVRTENDPAIEFTTDADLRLVRPRLSAIVALPATANPDSTAENTAGVRAFTGEGPFAIFSDTPRPGDALYLCFEADVSGNLVELSARCVQAAATGLNEQYPAQKWEVWNGIDNRWDPLEVPRDTTFGFNRSVGHLHEGQHTGFIELAMPAGLAPRQVAGRKGYWVRCVYATDLPPVGKAGLVPAAYERPPEVLALSARTIGGSAPASNCAVIRNLDLGRSDGTPGQVFALGHAPILALRPGESVLVGPPDTPQAEWEAWMAVPDFASSGPEDRHFVCDLGTGEIRFGPSVRQPDGTSRQHGAVPPHGDGIRFTLVRQGGGTTGNVGAHQIQVLKTSIPYIAQVYNPVRADGGREQETLEHAKLRAQAALRQRDRAVTAEDFEWLAGEASPVVARARCIQPRARTNASGTVRRVPPGVVRVLLIPTMPETLAAPRLSDLRVPDSVRADVERYLDERRLLATVLEVGAPEYVFVSTDVSLAVDPKASPEEVARLVRERLTLFLHPLRGGVQGKGWPFGGTLTLADIYAQIQACPGVAFLLDVRLYLSRAATAGQDALTPEHPVQATEGIELDDHEVLSTREHRVQARPLSAVQV